MFKATLKKREAYIFKKWIKDLAHSPKIVLPMTSMGMLREFSRDASGAYSVLAALTLPALIGMAGLGTEVGYWIHNHQTAQSASDSAAITAATAYYWQGNSANITSQARGVTASYGLRNGVGGVSVNINRPPLSGGYTSNPSAVEIIIQQPQSRFFSNFFTTASLSVNTRSVAVVNGAGQACVLALNPSASGAISVQGTADVNLQGCSLFANSSSNSAITANGNADLVALSVGAVGGISGQNKMTTTQGIISGQTAMNDPYAALTMPSYSGCDKNNYKAQNNATISPGVYCGGIKVNAGANLTLNPGTYIIDGGGFDVNGNSSVTGAGVTLVFTSSSESKYASATINGGANVNLTAPTSGSLAGIVMFGDQNMTTGTAFKFNGGSSQTFEGAVYLPKADVTYTGGNDTANGCTQIIADTIKFSGNANVAVNCSNTGISAIGGATAKLVE